MLGYLQGTEIQNYISKAIQILGGVVELAHIAGVSERTVYAWKNGERHPSRANLARLCQHFEMLEEKKRKEQAANKQAQTERNPSSPHSSQVTENGFNSSTTVSEHTLVPYANLSLGSSSACNGLSSDAVGQGHGRAILPVSATACWSLYAESYPFPLSWLGEKPCKNPDELFFMQMPGRSMEPTIGNADICLVNKADISLADDGVYAVKYADAIFIKRVCCMPGCYVFRGDNREFAHQDMQVNHPATDEGWEVVGRIIWTARTL